MPMESTLGVGYANGERGYTQNYNKANKLFLRAGKLGCAAAHYNIGVSYNEGDGVKRDAEKAKQYFELAAMGGNVYARHNLGALEWNGGNHGRALKHFMISVGGGYDASLKKVRDCYMCGIATKGDFEKALRAHKDAKDDMKSDQRDAAAAFMNLSLA